jgi:hypothetical protein
MPATTKNPRQSDAANKLNTERNRLQQERQAAEKELQRQRDIEKEKRQAEKKKRDKQRKIEEELRKKTDDERRKRQYPRTTPPDVIDRIRTETIPSIVCCNTAQTWNWIPILKRRKKPLPSKKNWFYDPHPRRVQGSPAK